jgi:hypothetical protein
MPLFWQMIREIKLPFLEKEGWYMTAEEELKWEEIQQEWRERIEKNENKYVEIPKPKKPGRKAFYKEYQSPFSQKDFEARRPAAITANFVRQYAARLKRPSPDGSLTEIQKKLLKCKYLPGSPWRYPCHQLQSCPFCQFDELALPLMETLWEQYEKYGTDPELRLAGIRIQCLEQVINPSDVPYQLDLLLQIKKTIQNRKIIREIPGNCKWYRPVLFRAEKSNKIYMALNILYLAKAGTLKEFRKMLKGGEYGIELPEDGTWRVSRFYVRRPSRKAVTRQVGVFYRYQDWLFLQRAWPKVEEYLATKIYKQQVQGAFPKGKSKKEENPE